MSLITDFLSIFPTSPSEMKLNLFTLNFDGSSESKLKKENFESNLGQKRIGIIMGVILLALFGLFDMYLIPETKYLAWFVRFGLMVPISLFLFMFTYSERIYNFTGTAFPGLVVLSGLAHIAVLNFAGESAAGLYYVGIAIYLLYGMFINNDSFVGTLVSNSLIVASYFIYLFMFSGLDISLKLSNSFIVLFAYFFSVLLSYFMVYNYKRNYYLAQNSSKGPRRATKGASREKQDENSKVEAKTVIKTIESPVNKIFENVNDLVWFITNGGEIKYISPSIKDFLGYEADELKDKRNVLLYTNESFADLDDALIDLNEGANKIRKTLEYKTKAGLIKYGDVIIKKYSDKRMGEGYLGVTRELEDFDYDTPKAEDLLKETEELKIVKANLETEMSTDKDELINLRKSNFELEDKVKELTNLVESLSDNNVSKARVDNLIKEYKDVIIMMDKFNEVEIHSNLSELSIKTNEMLDNFNNQSMKKYQLENYLNEVVKSLNILDKGKVIEQERLQLIHEYLEPIKEDKEKYVFVDMLQDSIISLGHLFKDTKHIFEIDCPDELELSIEKTRFTNILRGLIINTFTHGFKGVKKGIIELTSESMDNSLVITYKDNGKEYKKDQIDDFFREKLDLEEDGYYGINLQLIKFYVEENLKGTMGLDYTGTKNTIRLVIPTE